MKHAQTPAKPSDTATRTPGSTFGASGRQSGRFFAWFNRVIVLLTVLFVLMETLGVRRSFLWKLQDLDLFVFNRTFWSETMGAPGGLTAYLAAFFTQFFYLPWLGTLWYMAFLWLVAWLSSRAFRLKGYLTPFTTIPVLAILLMLTQLGYEVHLIKLQGYPFLPAIGTTALLVAFIGFASIRQPVSQCVYLVLWILFGFPLFGAYALAGSCLMLLMALRMAIRTRDTASWVPVAVGLLAVVVIPLLLYGFVYDRPCLSRFYVSLLPDFQTTETVVLWLPYVLLAGFLLTVTLTMPLSDVPWRGYLPPHPTLKVQRLTPTVLWLATLLSVHFIGFRDKAFNTELDMQAALETENWQGILSLARAFDEEPTRMMVMHTNLALFKLGLAGDQLFKYPTGNRPQHTRGNVLMVQMAGAPLYYQYGHLNYAYRWSMETMVEYGMSVHSLKYAVLSSALNGESTLAKKYNDVLKKTLFYRKWAESREAIIKDPGRAFHSPSLLNILRLNAFNDELDGDHSLLETFLLNHTAHSRGGNPELIELSILANLQLKQADRFWPRFLIHANTQPRIPVHFQEAALLFNLQQPHPALEALSFDPWVLKRFRLFIEQLNRYNNQPRERVAALVAKEFKGTYWYYYFFTNLQLRQATNLQDERP